MRVQTTLLKIHYSLAVQTALGNQKSTFLNSLISDTCLLCRRQDSNCHVLTTASWYLKAVSWSPTGSRPGPWMG